MNQYFSKSYLPVIIYYSDCEIFENVSTATVIDRSNVNWIGFANLKRTIATLNLKHEISNETQNHGTRAGSLQT